MPFVSFSSSEPGLLPGVAGGEDRIVDLLVVEGVFEVAGNVELIPLSLLEELLQSLAKGIEVVRRGPLVVRVMPVHVAPVDVLHLPGHLPCRVEERAGPGGDVETDAALVAHEVDLVDGGHPPGHRGLIHGADRTSLEAELRSDVLLSGGGKHLGLVLLRLPLLRVHPLLLHEDLAHRLDLRHLLPRDVVKDVDVVDPSTSHDTTALFPEVPPDVVLPEVAKVNELVQVEVAELADRLVELDRLPSRPRAGRVAPLVIDDRDLVRPVPGLFYQLLD